MEYDIKFEEGNFIIDGQQIPEKVINYDLGMKNSTDYERLTISLAEGEGFKYKCNKNTRVTFHVEGKNQLQEFLECIKEC